jgi:recombination protein RecA
MAEPTQSKELKEALLQIEKQIGKNAIMKLGDHTLAEVQGVPTGILSVDLALGGKGLPRGRVIEIFGPESSGKTTLALHAVANAQRQGGVAAFIDVEHALDAGWAKRLGVDLEGLLVSQPSSAEEALKIAEMLVKSNAVDVIVIDSVAALVPEAEVKGEIGDAQVGVQARLMSQAMRILTPVIGRTRTCMIFINQIRMKIGVMFGSPETTSGGQALKFYSSVRLDIRKITSVKDGEDTVGSRVRVKVVKNKIAPPFKQAEFDLFYDRGACREGDLIDLAVEDGMIDKSGSWLSYGEQRWQGRDKLREHLRENPQLVEEIRNKILIKRGLLPAEPVSPESNGKATEAAAKPEAKKESAGRRQPAASAS